MWPQVSGLSFMSQKHRIVKQSGEAEGSKCVIKFPGWSSSTSQQGPVSFALVSHWMLTYLQERHARQPSRKIERLKTKASGNSVKAFVSANAQSFPKTFCGQLGEGKKLSFPFSLSFLDSQNGLKNRGLVGCFH